jgi:hypothetical protein
VLLAHSPGASPNETTTAEIEAPLPPIPGVYADIKVTTSYWPDSHQVITNTEELLNATAPYVQISSHGDEFSLHTGPGGRWLSAFELAYALDRAAVDADVPPIRALITVACSTTQAGTNIMGESGGWPVILERQVGLVLGALYPVDDVFSTLWLLLLHRQWHRCGDLRSAVIRVREQMRSGAWAETEHEGRELQSLWAEALTVAAERARELGAPDYDVELLSNATALVGHYYTLRQDLYDVEPRFQSVTEAFVAFG